MRDVITDRRNQMLLCAVLTVATVMAGFNQSAMSSVLPEIAIHFNVDVGVASWVESIYLLFMAGLILIFGKICDKGLMKKVLFYGIIAFMVGALCCILLDSYALILVARAVQGIGGSTIWCASVVIGVRYLPKELVAWAMVSITAGEALGNIAGPLMGGVITSFFGWKALFFLDLVLGSVALSLVWKVIPEDRFTGMRDFDVKGACMLAVVMFTGPYCLEIVAYNGFTPLAILLSLTFIVSLFLFFRFNKRASDPIIDLSLFENRNTNRLTFLYIIELVTINGLLYLVPLYSFIILGYDSIEKGFLMFIPAIVALISSFIIGRIYVDRKKKPFLYVTSAAITVSSVSMALVSFSPMSSIMICLVLSGVLWALGEVAIVSVIVNSAPDSKRCRSSVVNSYIGNLCDAMGVVMFSKLFVIGSRTEGIPVTDVTPVAFMNGLYLITAICLVLSVLSFVLIVRFKENLIERHEDDDGTVNASLP